MYVFRANVNLGNASGTIDIPFSVPSELDTSMDQLAEMGFSFDVFSSSTVSNRRLCPTHKEELKESKRKPGTLYCPHKTDDNIYCKYEEKA